MATHELEQGNGLADERLAEAVSLHRAGNTQAAERLYRDILLEHPNQANANYNLGVIALEEKHADDSLLYFKAALEADPQEEQYWLSYIRALIQAEHFDDAQLVLSYGVKAGLAGKEVESLALTLETKLKHAAVALPPSTIEDELIELFSQQRYEEVENKILALVQQYPHWLVGWKILSDTFLIQGKDARLPALRALELNANDAKEHCYYGLILKNQGDLKGAATAFEQAIKLKPDYAAAYNNLGIVKKDAGDIDAGIREYRKALALNPGYAGCYSNLLFCLSHSEKIDTRTLFEEHCNFSKQYELPLKAAWTKHKNKRDPQRCLQVGFVTADFRDHSLAYFIEPLLTHLALSLNLSLHAYSTSPIEDSITQRLRGKFRYWNKVDALSDTQLADKIREDGIDILVDLNGHTAGNSLLTFAMKPAPIQASWLGYLSTTGLTAMDYYLADSYLLPPGQLDDQFTEKLVQLPANAPFLPSEVAPEVNALPALKNGYMTFACFNRPNKITPSVVSLWCKLLNALPNARMLLGAMPNDGSYDSIIDWFAQGGVGRERLIFHPRSFMKNYLKLHHEVDVCLDTFPSNGVTTTCHAVWMGVPTLCMEGKSMASRGALDVMKQVGLDDFVADDEAAFVEHGIFWASHTQQLAEVRASLRSRFEQSPLAKPAMIAEGLEIAFRQMWQRWCDKLPAASFAVTVPEPVALQPAADNGLIYVTQPLLPALDDFIPYMRKIWDNKLLTNGGPFHQQLEQALCDYLGVKHIALFANGTLALLTALQALRITGEVITTPYSFVATAHSLLWNGIKPVFVDIDPVSLNMDPAKIEAAITPQTTAIMPVHCYGHPCDVDRIQKIADDYNLRVIYDAAHSFGVQHQGGSLLNYGDLSVLSFHATKVFNTFEGGAIVCPDAKTKQRIDHLKNFGFVDELTVVAAGINGKMSEVNAAFGLLQLKGIDAALLKRKEVDTYYRQQLAAIAGIHCLADAGEEVANYSYFPILVQPEYPLSRDALYQKLRDAGIYARRYFYPLISEFPMYRGMPSATQGNLPAATKASHEVICLPIYPDLQASQVDRIVDLIRVQALL
ncbi:MAG TPA: aminotransferase class I/II-fold pyridoxal phosphate-dependent enzyme [Methylophilaceae bacterium]|nr:aminotransferase class I/II-fold pyridoxal phosphate-dependent enzyme [Methylophilaceae bacterium]